MSFGRRQVPAYVPPPVARAVALAPRPERIAVPAGVLTGGPTDEDAEHAAWRAGYRTRLWRRWSVKLLLLAGLPVSLLAPAGTSDLLLWGLRIAIVALLVFGWSKDRSEAKAAGLR
ncbi:hypothetical protein [Phenylobacterium sp.]|uniref:hypothetical protein n=1 Tax=Phenylobacterium sp. TaxID=1871053 RepID=UPI00271946DD|nr:hypothetical protein [Phenylobacterium sp.]MDO8378657.1 hypothetical protein [Phenylobacterium sp.]